MTDVVPSALAEIEEHLTTAERAQLRADIASLSRARVFFPTLRQQLVVDNPADVIGYGGAAGGGKSYLMCGLAVSAHRRTAIIRPQKNQTQKFVLEIAKMLPSGQDGYNSASSTFNIVTPDHVSRFIKFFGLDNPGDEEKQQGEDFDAKLYDEVTQMREADVRYTLTWNRTDDPNQRVRAVLAFNPPTTPEGRWVVKYFAPWLDKFHPNPARDGELRWFVTRGEDRDYEVSSPQPFVWKWVGVEQLPWYNFDPADYPPEEVITPESRTFIHAKVTDNPYYMRTNYLRKLQALPEPLRSQMMNGDFEAGIEDDARQIIPSSHIYAAVERWRTRDEAYRNGSARKPPMDSLGVDVARGGNMGGAAVAAGSDELCIAARHGTFFDSLLPHKGVDINDGAKAAALIIQARRDHAPVHIDVVGVGTSPFDFLNENHVHTVAVNGTAAADGSDASGLLRFANLRAKLHWRMREALDPANPDPIALPPDPQMIADLAAPRWFLSKSGIQVEPKEDVKKRLGRSPDRGEAVLNALISTPKREMVLGGILGLPAHLQGDYEARRLKELE